MKKNITIPYELLVKVIEILECLSYVAHDSDLDEDYDDVLFALKKKQASIELREAYSRIIYAEDEEARFDARMNYLQEKRRVRDTEPF